jgi:hypothetical protein
MTDSASNQKRSIATAYTEHVAKTADASDRCYIIGRKDQDRSFKNFTPTKDRLDEGTNSQNTTIYDAIVWIDGGKTTRTDPMHPPYVLAYNTDEIYRKPARNTTCSLDLFIEGKGVVRTQDGTKQNGENCDGYVDGDELSDFNRRFTDEFFAKRCTLVSLTGECGDQGLGREEEDSEVENYLEIFSGDEVVFTAVRENRFFNPPRQNTSCSLEPKHTLWLAERTGAGLDAESDDGSGETFNVGSSLTEIKGWQKYAPSEVGAGPVQVSFEPLVTMFRVHNDPPRVAVTASACSGDMVANLRIFPKNPAKLIVDVRQENEKSYYKDDPPAIATALKRFRTIKEGAKTLTALASVSGFEVDFKLFVGFSFELEVGYERCTKEETNDDRYVSTAHIGRYWTLKLEASPLCELSVTGAAGVLTVLGIVFPALAPWCMRADKFLGDTIGNLELFLTAGIGVSITYEFGQDAHGDTTSKEIRKFGVLIRLDGGIRLRAGGTSKIEAFIGVTAEPAVEVGPNEKSSHLLRVRFSGEIKTYARLVVKSDWLREFLERVPWLEPEIKKNGPQWKPATDWADACPV